jgi:hypothetical protein
MPNLRSSPERTSTSYGPKRTSGVTVEAKGITALRTQADENGRGEVGQKFPLFPQLCQVRIVDNYININMLRRDVRMTRFTPDLYCAVDACRGITAESKSTTIFKKEIPNVEHSKVIET